MSVAAALTAVAPAPPASANAPSVLGSAEEEAASLAENLDNVIKVCSAISIRGGSTDKSIRRPEQAAVDKGLLKFFSSPPPELVALSNPKFGAARYGQWFDPHANIFVIGYDNSPVCRAIVGNSRWVSSSRPALYKLVQNDAFWIASELDKPVDGAANLKRAVFRAASPSGVQPMLTITTSENAGPDDGRPQMMITVALVGKEN